MEETYNKSKLSKSQWVILRRWLDGLTVQEIADEYEMHVSSIYAHLSRIYTKLNSVDFHYIKRWVQNHDNDLKQS